MTLHTIPHRIISYHTVPYHTITLHPSTLHYITWRYVTVLNLTLRYSTSHYITLPYVTVFHIILHYSTFHSIPFYTYTPNWLHFFQPAFSKHSTASPRGAEGSLPESESVAGGTPQQTTLTCKFNDNCRLTDKHISPQKIGSETLGWCWVHSVQTCFSYPGTCPKV